MPVAKAVRELTAPDLVKKWRSLVNDNVMMGRDAHLLKEALEIYTPVQLLYGMYLMRTSKTVSIPQFLNHPNQWLMDDELDCSIELARLMTNTVPKEYWLYRDFKDADSAAEVHFFEAAKTVLIDWADRILS